MKRLNRIHIDTQSTILDHSASLTEYRYVVADILKSLFHKSKHVLINSPEIVCDFESCLNSLKNYPNIYQASMPQQFAVDFPSDIEQITLKDEPKDWYIKTADFGDTHDRPLQHRSGEYTQLLEDLSIYHQILQDHCDRIIVLRPHNHSGYDVLINAAMRCLGYSAAQFQFIVVRPLKLYAFHEPTQKLNAIPDLPADELIQAIGMDTIRWHSLSFPLTEIAPINISTAAQPIPQNSLYHVQAAHARCCVLLRQAHQQNLIQLDTEDQWNIDAASKDLADFTWANTCANELVKHIQSTSDILHQAAEQIAPHLICQHLEAISNICHQWCNSLEPNAQDYVLLLAAKQKLFDLLHNILGIKTPEFIEANQPVIEANQPV